MKILIITQKVDINDDNLGFFHAWIEEFAKNLESVSVICLEKGKYNFPQNVKIFSLGKEENNFLPIFKFQIFKKIKYLNYFYKYIWRERKNYDAVFIHMNPEYAILGGFFWKILNKKIYLWYVHKKTNFKLKFAEKLVDKIFTASKESFRLSSKKIIITGHGIDTDKFNLSAGVANLRKKFIILTAGRIAAAKNLNILIEACVILKEKNFNFSLKIAGRPILKQDEAYFNYLKSSIKEKTLNDRIEFIGSVPYKDIADFYRSGDLFVNLSNTGSIDKAVLEAMASGLKVLTSNAAFKRILPDYCLAEDNAQEIAEKIIYLFLREFKDNLREYVVNHHNLRDLIKKLTQLMF